MDTRDAENTPRSVTLTIESRLENVFFLGIMVQNLCRFMDIEPALCDGLELAVVEAANNAIIHAYAREPGHPVEVTILATAESLVFQVSDRGKKMDITLSPCPPYEAGSLGALPQDKMGLFLIISAVDTADYSSIGERNVLTLTKYLK